MLPSISIVIPTLNAAQTLSDCLASVAAQEYPREDIEILVVDGGSRDATGSIAEKFKVVILNNPLKTGEAGKALGIRQAKNELVLLIDSDNILVGKDWLRKMVQPFVDPQIVAAEPLRYLARPTDSFINRYCALIGMNDPFCIFLGNYDRYNYITNKWTEIPIKVEKKRIYIKFRATGTRFMTMGANGFLARREKLLPYAQNDYYFDIDVSKDLAINHQAYFAKVDVGIIHLFADNFGQFIKKQNRRVKDFLHFRDNRKLSVRLSSQTSDIPLDKIFVFSVSTILIIPLAVQSFIGYLRKPDMAWLVHIPVCWITLFIYATTIIRAKLFASQTMMSREKW